MSATADKRYKFVSNEFSENSDSNDSSCTNCTEINTTVMSDIQDKSFKNGKVCKSKKRLKSFNKNALMARENRLKKKLYIESLEKNSCFLQAQNKNLASIVDNQSILIKDLRQQIKYLKSVLANSSDISMLMKTIRSNTGMSVTTSLDKSLKIGNCISKPELNHPWKDRSCCYPNKSPILNSYMNVSNEEETFLNCSHDPNEFLLFPQIEDINSFEDVVEDTLNEHNYTAKLQSEFSTNNDGDVGVCLHVSKHRVSLEFCSSCSDNASISWKK